jgi:hypothetical protein
MIIRESQIEDVLATYPDIAKDLLGISEELTLLSRQKILPSGNKLDLLFIAGTKLKLLELKVEPFQEKYVEQTTQYKNELIELQMGNKLVNGSVDAYLLCPSISEREEEICKSMGIKPVKYSPEFVLESFFSRLKNLAGFMTIKPADHGLWNLHLLNRLLYQMERIQTKEGLVRMTGLSRSTMGSYLRFAEEIRLVTKKNRNQYILTELGKKYVWNRDPNAPEECISDEQADVLQDFIIKDPFASRAIYGIYTIVESVFTLSKNTYPVPLNLAINYFRESSGKFFEWSSKKAALDGTKMYSNYATELGLIGRIGDKFYITPNGVRFILLLQLHKTIKTVDALRITTR